MLQLNIQRSEYFDDRMQEFFYVEPCTVTLEHSLLAVSKWESKWKLPFLSSQQMRKMTVDQLLDYFKCMEVEPASEPLWPLGLSQAQQKQLIDYINEDQTATTFYTLKKEKGGYRQTVTSELIYYWMTGLNIPFSCETWHLSRLLTLIRVASIKGQTGKKMTKREALTYQAELNEKRKKQYNTRG